MGKAAITLFRSRPAFAPPDAAQDAGQLRRLVPVDRADPRVELLEQRRSDLDRSSKRQPVSCNPAHVRSRMANGGLVVANHGVQQGFLLALAAVRRTVHPAG